MTKRKSEKIQESGDIFVKEYFAIKVFFSYP